MISYMEMEMTTVSKSLDRKYTCDCLTGNGYRISFGVMKCTQIDCGDGSQPCEHTQKILNYTL